jgi:uncharacterized membrane protein
MMIYPLLLKLIHIFFGIVWAGGIFMMVLFIMPAAKKLGPDGGKFMQQLSQTNNFIVVINIAAVLTILSGALILWRISSGMRADWLTSGYGICLTTGSILALIAYFLGFFVQRPAALKIAALGKEISSSGSPPAEEKMIEMAFHQRILEKAARIGAILIVLSVISMPVAKFIII